MGDLCTREPRLTRFFPPDDHRLRCTGLSCLRGDAVDAAPCLQLPERPPAGTDAPPRPLTPTVTGPFSSGNCPVAWVVPVPGCHPRGTCTVARRRSKPKWRLSYYALEYAAPFRDDSECLRWLRYPHPPGRRRRIEIFCNAYGITVPADITGRVAWQQRLVMQNCQALACQGIEPRPPGSAKATSTPSAPGSTGLNPSRPLKSLVLGQIR
jgi:hypothetical protein